MVTGCRCRKKGGSEDELDIGDGGGGAGVVLMQKYLTVNTSTNLLQLASVIFIIFINKKIEYIIP